MAKRFLVWAFVLASCTYSFVQTSLPRGNAVWVEQFENSTGFYGIENVFFTALVSALEEGGQFVVKKKAPYVISGELLEFSDEPKVYTATGVVERYEVKIKAMIEWRDVVADSVIYEGTVEGAGVYSEGEDRMKGIEIAVNEMIRKIVSGVLVE